MTSKFLTPIERETSIIFNDAEDTATIVTYMRPIITKLKKNPNAILVEEWYFGKTIGAEFTIPANLIRFGTTRKATRKPMTDAQKKAVGERMKAYHASKKAS